MTLNPETFDVLIVGAGPVGLTLANLLGVHGVSTLVLERNPQLEGEPRAVSLDDESLRTLQAAGLVDEVLRDVVLGYGVQYVDWRGRPFAAIQPTRQEYGYPKRNAFRQPLLVRTLHAGLARFAHVQLRFGHALQAFEQNAAGVACRVQTADGERTLKARWLVACDGGRSTVRELCGARLDGSTYPERWLIVDLAERTVPLRHTRTYCDPRRPAIRLPGPHGTLRYEFMLRAGDRDETVLDEAVFRRWIGERVPEDRDLPLVRKAVYGFHARVATSWKHGRVLLAGDAAHLTPPFAGQGLNSGLRDAANLAWKLAAVTRWGAAETLLDSYEPERRPHAAALIRMALRIGAFMQPKTLLGAALAQTALRAACLLPPVRDYVLQLRFKPRPLLRRGWFEPAARRPHAELLAQPRVDDGQCTLPLDEVLGRGFAVIGWDTPDFRAAAAALLPPGAPGRIVALLRREDDFLAPQPAGAALAAAPPTASAGTAIPPPSAGITVVRDAGGELAQLLDTAGAVAAVVRPDRYWSRLLPAAALQAPASLPWTSEETSSCLDLPIPAAAR